MREEEVPRPARARALGRGGRTRWVLSFVLHGRDSATPPARAFATAVALTRGPALGHVRSAAGPERRGAGRAAAVLAVAGWSSRSSRSCRVAPCRRRGCCSGAALLSPLFDLEVGAGGGGRLALRPPEGAGRRRWPRSPSWRCSRGRQRWSRRGWPGSATARPRGGVTPPRLRGATTAAARYPVPRAWSRRPARPPAGLAETARAPRTPAVGGPLEGVRTLHRAPLSRRKYDRRGRSCRCGRGRPWQK